MKKKQPWEITTHWLPTKESEAAACGVKSRDLIYDSSPNMERVTCKNCLRKSPRIKIRCTTHHICDCLAEELETLRNIVKRI